MLIGFNDPIITRVQQANDIVEVISEHLRLDRKGREMVGLCPFHEDHRPSMYVNPVKQIFKCFACGVGGDVFKFIQLRCKFFRQFFYLTFSLTQLFSCQARGRQLFRYMLLGFFRYQFLPVVRVL